MNCDRCELSLHASPKAVCLKGEGIDVAPLLIFFDHPNMVEDRRAKGFVGDPADLLKWILSRMSVPLKKVRLEYALRCFPNRCKDFSKKPYRLDFIQSCSVYRFATLQKCRPRAVVACGSVCCEAFVGSKKVSDFEGVEWTPQEPEVRNYIESVWITYSPAYALESPAEVVSIYRTIYEAARRAGLNPHLDKTVKPYTGWKT